MVLAMLLTAASSAAVVGPWLVAVAASRHAGAGPGTDGSGPPSTSDGYTLAA